ncbi:MAG: hypothetical protein ACYTEL_06250 [Planctomycetota bacterium]|jgi:hypothetical protein
MKKYVVKLMIVAILATVAALVSHAVANRTCWCYRIRPCEIDFECTEWGIAGGSEWQECNPHDWWDVPYCETVPDITEHCEEDTLALCRGVDHYSCEYCCGVHFKEHTHRYVKQGDTDNDSQCN